MSVRFVVLFYGCNFKSRAINSMRKTIYFGNHVTKPMKDQWRRTHMYGEFTSEMNIIKAQFYHTAGFLQRDFVVWGVGSVVRFTGDVLDFINLHASSVNRGRNPTNIYNILEETVTIDDKKKPLTGANTEHEIIMQPWIFELNRIPAFHFE